MLDPLTRTVMNMMTRFGGDATLVVTTGEGSYDPSTSTTTPVTQQYTVRIVADDFIQRGSGLASETNGLIQTGDKHIYIRPAAGVPKPRVGVDSIIFEGNRWVIHTMKEYNPSGVNPYLYEVYARQ